MTKRTFPRAYPDSRTRRGSICLVDHDLLNIASVTLAPRAISWKRAAPPQRSDFGVPVPARRIDAARKVCRWWPIDHGGGARKTDAAALHRQQWLGQLRHRRTRVEAIEHDD